MLALGDEASNLELATINFEVETIADLAAKIPAINCFAYDDEDDSSSAGILQVLQTDVERIAVARVSRGRELRPEEVLSDLFGEDDFLNKLPSDTDGAAEMAVQRLVDAGFC